MQASKEDAANKVTSINADADDVHYPTAKAVKDKLKAEINDYNEFVDNDKYSEVVLSRNKRIVESTDAEGNKTVYGNLTVNGELINPVIKNINQNLDKKIDGEYDLQGRYAEVLVDDYKKIIESIDKTGKHNFNCGIGIANFESDFTKDDAQYVIVELDADDKIHHAVKKDGTHVFPVGIEVPKKTDIYKGVCINALGDSLSNGFEYMFGCRDSLKMKIGGSMVGGSPISGDGEFAFWKDNRINALSSEAKIILIQGGTNDYNQVGDLDITNTDTNTLCGAFNVMMSKLYYKYLSKVNAYYGDVDYTGITRVEHPVKRLPIVVIIPPLAPSPQYEARVTGTAKALVDISMLWGLGIIDARRIGYNVISGAGIDMVHGAKKFFDVLSDKIVSYFTDVAKSMSHLQEQEKPNFRITVNANTFGGKSDAFAAVDDNVYITFSSLPNNVIVEDKDNNTISIEWVDRLTNLACQFKMPNSDVVITIN